MEQPYPFLIDFYKGKGHILAVPSAQHIIGFLSQLDYYDEFPESVDSKAVGNSVLSMLEMIKNSPLLSTTKEERAEQFVWTKATKYKSYRNFTKTYLCCKIWFFENGEYKIAVKERADKGGYGPNLKIIELPADTTTEEIGQAVLDGFKAAEEFYAK